MLGLGPGTLRLSPPFYKSRGRSSSCVREKGALPSAGGTGERFRQDDRSSVRTAVFGAILSVSGGQYRFSRLRPPFWDHSRPFWGGICAYYLGDKIRRVFDVRAGRSVGLRPGLSRLGLSQEGDGQLGHPFHLLLHQPADGLGFLLRTLHDQLVVDLEDQLPRQTLLFQAA